MAIAEALLPFEKIEKLLVGDWYALLFNALIAADKTANNERLSVVTFNYDRSLEMFLHMAFKNTYRLDDDTAAKRVQEHVGIVPLAEDVHPAMLQKAVENAEDANRV